MSGIARAMHLRGVHVEPAIAIVCLAFCYCGLIVAEQSAPKLALYPEKVYQSMKAIAADWTYTPEDDTAFEAVFWLSCVGCDFLDLAFAYRMHCEACRIGRRLGYFNIDESTSSFSPSSSVSAESGDEVERNQIRLACWDLIGADCLFRLVLRKPTQLPPDTWRVNIPSLGTEKPCSPAATLYETYTIVKMRITLIQRRYYDEVAANTALIEIERHQAVAALMNEVFTVIASSELVRHSNLNMCRC